MVGFEVFKLRNPGNGMNPYKEDSVRHYQGDTVACVRVASGHFLSRA
jgi:hypothetical protein